MCLLIEGSRETSSLLKARYGERKISDELAQDLRAHTPTNEIRNMVNKNIDELIGKPGSALPNKVIEGKLEADHIVSVDRITKWKDLNSLHIINNCKY